MLPSGKYNQSHLVEIRGLIREALKVDLLGPGEAGLHRTDLVAVARAVDLKGLDHHIEEGKSLEGQVGRRDRGQKSGLDGCGQIQGLEGKWESERGQGMKDIQRRCRPYRESSCLQTLKGSRA